MSWRTRTAVLCLEPGLASHLHRDHGAVIVGPGDCEDDGERWFESSSMTLAADFGDA
ncbi:MAG TPA: hypothetical protein VJM33_08150 [Microthrixaceae bacterium]|nr:hypothetical protein [Microthrixaceae bacterium]